MTVSSHRGSEVALASPSWMQQGLAGLPGFDKAVVLTWDIRSFVMGTVPFKDETRAVVDGAYTVATVP